jgi:hypothetical protein
MGDTLSGPETGPGSEKGVMKDEGVQKVRGDGTSGRADKRMQKKIFNIFFLSIIPEIWFFV